MIVIVVLYGFMKAEIMLNFLDNTIQEPSKSNYFPSDYIYNSSDGFRVAFALVAYDSSSDARPFDETFGSFGAYLKIWGETDENGDIKPTYFKPLETEKCQKSDINLDGDSNIDAYKFYEPSEEYKADANRFYNQLNCIKNDDAELMGDYNSVAGKQLIIKFDMCVDDPEKPEIKCKDEKDIKQWLNRKFLLFMEVMRQEYYWLAILGVLKRSCKLLKLFQEQLLPPPAAVHV